jgi:hypothetical protein
MAITSGNDSADPGGETTTIVAVFRDTGSLEVEVSANPGSET